MRYMLRNTVRDPETFALRTQNAARVQLRPMIGGSPLPPGSSRLFRLNEFTVSLLAEIDRFSAIGNVRLYCVGKSGGVADTDGIRRLLRLPVAASPVGQSGPPSPPPVQAVPETSAPTAPVVVEAPVVVPAAAPAVEETVEAPAAEMVVAEEPVAAPVESTAPVEEAVEAAPESEPVVDPRREELEAMKLTELRDLLVAMGGKSSGKNKPVLVDEILELERA